MARKRLDPSMFAGPEPDPPPARRERAAAAHGGEPRPLTVSQVSDLITRTLEERLPSPLRVIGEISNLSTRNHWYFSLKDDKSVLSCVAWASTARRLSFTPRDGQEVVATGQVGHYAPQGRTQFYVTDLKPVGEGALEARFKALCEELRALGYFDDARKRQVPAYPGRIAVVTSIKGAALQDVIATAAQRWKGVGLLVFDARVQGEGAAEDVARTIRRINRERVTLGVEAILVTRGGGSIEDLWAFNERVVADAIVESVLPVVAAIGHESDVTIAELVADLRAATPTQAVMRLVPAATELARQIDHLEHRQASLLARRLERERERLALLSRTDLLRGPRAVIERLAERLEHRQEGLSLAQRHLLAQHRLDLDRLSRRLFQLRPADVSARQRERLSVASNRLRAAIAHRLALARRVLDGREQTLRAFEVHGVLRRGFSYTTHPDGGLIRSISDVNAGDPMLTHLADGVVRSVVGDRMVRKPRRAGSGASGGLNGGPSGGADQLDLFASSE
ncbi:MAG: exodeoxyribonuclease VII large subunit [Phycisphaeraceae bacterium]|nr:exodeoxyribonuclease VII large subunit [Phycisphaerales bacterium]QOJ17983.1 MAG: exodeoxyribonuclease VII large subunit [Phycisphaeraceae bacterium]